MRQLRRILRLHHEGASTRDIVRVVGIARTTIQRALERSKAAGLGWPLSDDMTDEVLEARLFAGAGTQSSAGTRKHPEPNWAELSRELRRPAVTMMILWDEYRRAWPAGYGYSRFCELLRDFQQRLSPVMRQHHVAGDKLFVDYSGKRLGISDPLDWRDPDGGDLCRGAGGVELHLRRGDLVANAAGLDRLARSAVPAHRRCSAPPGARIISKAG